MDPDSQHWFKLSFTVPLTYILTYMRLVGSRNNQQVLPFVNFRKFYSKNLKDPTPLIVKNRFQRRKGIVCGGIHSV